MPVEQSTSTLKYSPQSRDTPESCNSYAGYLLSHRRQLRFTITLQQQHAENTPDMPGRRMVPTCPSCLHVQ